MDEERRRFVQFAVVSLGVSVSASCGNALTSGDDVHTRAPSGKGFSAAERELVEVLCDLILPATDTPGALESGVAVFLENLFAQWMRADERVEFRAGLLELESKPGEFVGASPDRQQQMLSAAFAGAGVESAATLQALAASERPFVLQLRDMVVLGHYTSKVGATQALKYNPVPGSYDGAYPVAGVGTHEP